MLKGMRVYVEWVERQQVATAGEDNVSTVGKGRAENQRYLH
jgi:hypothetical protein